MAVHANVVWHRDQLYLIPHSDSAHADQTHSLIRLMDSTTSLPCNTLRAMLEGGSHPSGRFMLEPSGFAEDGVMLALLLDMIECSAQASAGKRPSADRSSDDPGGGLIMLCRQLWARWLP